MTDRAREESAADDRSTGTMRRAARVGRAIVDMHVEIASREAARDARRVMTGVALMIAGATALASVIVLLQVAGTSYLHERTARSWSACALAMAGVDLAIAALLLAIGKSRLDAPLMPETRGLWRRTVDALTDE